jgi:hypothetical protein
MGKLVVQNFLKKGLESRSGVSIFRPPFLQHPAPKTRAGRKKPPRDRRFFPEIIFLKNNQEKVLTEQTKVRVVDIFPSWEGAL